MGEQIAKLQTELALLRSREVDRGAFVKLVVEKVLRRTDFRELVVKMSAVMINIGK